MPLKLETEVQGIGAILSARRLKVPIHQRPFAWTESEVSRLWEDLTRAQIEESEGYFLGPIVLSEPAPSTNRYGVIDGQQRLATISLLFAALARFLHQRGEEERARLLEEEYLGKKDIRTLEREPKLTLGEDDDTYFRELVDAACKGEELPKPEARRPSHQLVWGAYGHLYSRLEAEAKAASQSWLPRLVALVTYVREAVEVITVIVGSDQNAFLIFETLNDRGLRLTTTDLLKNHLFSQAGDRLDFVRKSWAEMTAGLEAVGGNDITATFLRHYWISNREMVRERFLFKRISVEIRTSRAAVELADGLGRSAEDYAALLTPSHSRWYRTAVRDDLAWLRVFRVETPRPLLLAALEELSERDFERVVSAVTRWSFRLAITGGLGSGTVEEAYGRAARKIRTGERTTPKSLRHELKDILPDDDSFRSAFAKRSIRNRRQLRYILLGLEQQLRQDRQESLELVPNQDEDKVDLEHILPRNPSKGTWTHVSEEDQPLSVDRIGNVALLRSTQNRAAAREEFTAKKECYEESDLLLTKALTDYESWDIDSIERRQERLARLAVRAWPL